MPTQLKKFIQRHETLFAFLFFLKHFKREIYSFLPARFADRRAYENDEPLHGDTTWQTLVRNILQEFPITAIVETGTFKGTTTDFFASHFSGPIFTCEVMGLYFRESRRRLKKHPQVQVLRGSSPDALASLKEKNLYGELPLFFLDAHWYNYWPIVDEFQIIKNLPRAIIMVDDFKVPAHPEFGYDSQKKDDGRIIENNLALLAEHLSPDVDSVYFPAYTEGISRGYVVIFHHIGEDIARLKNKDFFTTHYTEHKV